MPFKWPSEKWIKQTILQGLPWTGIKIFIGSSEYQICKIRLCELAFGLPGIADFIHGNVIWAIYK